MRNEGNQIEEKTYAFALQMVETYKFLSDIQKEFILSKQLLRSGTSIGAMVCEAKFAQSRADFINKLSIALKEANESKYWIRLLHDTHYIDDSIYLKLHNEIKEIIAMLVSIVRSSKNKPE